MDDVLTTLTTPIHLRRELLELGRSDRDIAKLVRGGVLHRVRHGAYVAADAWGRADDAERHAIRARSVVRQASTRLVVSHVSALPFFGAPTWGVALDDEVDVTRPDARGGRREAGVRQHRGLLLDEDVVKLHGTEVTSATKTALDVTCQVGTEASLVVINFFMRTRLTTLEALRARYGRMTQDPFTLKTDLALRLADDRLESVGEVRTAFMFFRWGVPAAVPQYEVLNTSGDLIARLDFAWPSLGVWLEFDGREKYVRYRRPGESVTDAVLREKQRESMIAELMGWRCIRITWADLERPQATVARILDILGVSSRAPSFT